MDAPFAHTITYDTTGTVPVASIAQSLVANDELLREIGELLESCVPGLSVERIDIGLSTTLAG